MAKAAVLGAVGAAGGDVYKRMKGKGKKLTPRQIAKKFTPLVHKKKKQIDKVFKDTSKTVTEKDLPKNVVKKAKKALAQIQANNKGMKMSKAEIIQRVVKPLTPHVAKALKKKVVLKLKGSGLRLAGSGHR